VRYSMRLDIQFNTSIRLGAVSNYSTMLSCWDDLKIVFDARRTAAFESLIWVFLYIGSESDCTLGFNFINNDKALPTLRDLFLHYHYFAINHDLSMNKFSSIPL